MDGLFWLSYDPDPVVLSLFLYQHSVQSFSSIITYLYLFTPAFRKENTCLCFELLWVDVLESQDFRQRLSIGSPQDQAIKSSVITLLFQWYSWLHGCSSDSSGSCIPTGTTISFPAMFQYIPILVGLPSDYSTLIRKMAHVWMINHDDFND